MDQTPATFQQVEAPPDRPALATAVVQLAAAVIVQKDGITSVPPHLASCVVLKDDPAQIVAIVGPQSDLASVQDAVVFSQAYPLRAALRELVRRASNVLQTAQAADDSNYGTVSTNTLRDELASAALVAQAALDAADPQFMRAERPSAEQQLTDARRGYDPALNPSTTGILSVEGVAVEGEDEAGASVHTLFTH